MFEALLPLRRKHKSCIKKGENVYMPNQFSRSQLILGKNALEKLKKARVAVFGIGGVGSYAAEALVRGGIGAIDVIDDDRVCLSNINRQLFATHETLGLYKTDAAVNRLKSINPELKITAHNIFYTPETAESIDLSCYDYIIDAIDTVTAKTELIVRAYKQSIPVISAMGAGNKLDPTAFRVSDIYKTSVCPLAKVMRSQLKKRGVKKLKVVYSQELPIKPVNTLPQNEEDSKAPADTAAGADTPRPGKRTTPGSVSFVPPVVGLIIAGEVIKDLTGLRGNGLGV